MLVLGQLCAKDTWENLSLKHAPKSLSLSLPSERNSELDCPVRITYSLKICKAECCLICVISKEMPHLPLHNVQILAAKKKLLLNSKFTGQDHYNHNKNLMKTCILPSWVANIYSTRFHRNEKPPCMHL